jgi:hypothetical protein
LDTVSLSLSMRSIISVCFLLLFVPVICMAQAIQGEVVDGNTGKPLDYVSVLNIYTKSGIVTEESGKFYLIGAEDELLEFKKMGYKTVRIRVPRMIPPYFKIVMMKGEVELPEFELYTSTRAKDYKTDSARYGELYKSVLDFPKMSAVQSLRSPFSALSKSNRQKWAFQENYAKFQKEKYIDYAFNDHLITSITGLTGDSLQLYKQRCRPSYEQVRNMSDYNYFLYIKESAARFRRAFSRTRNGG